MNVNQHVFVTEYLRHRNKHIAYATAYNLVDSSNGTAIESAANRLLRDPEIAAEIRKTYEAVRHEVEQEIAKEMRTELLTIQRKREILAKIATGDIYVEQHYKGKNCSQCSQYIRPTVNQMLKAIDLDSKLAGHYPSHAAVGSKQSATGSVQPPKVDAQLAEVIATPVPEVKTVTLPHGEPGGGNGEEIEVITVAGLEQLINLGEKTPVFTTNHNKLSVRQAHNKPGRD